MDIVTFTTDLVKSICKNPDVVSVSKFDLEEATMLEIIVSQEDKGSVIGKNGTTIGAIKTLIMTKAHIDNLSKIKVNVDSF